MGRRPLLPFYLQVVETFKDSGGVAGLVPARHPCLHGVLGASLPTRSHTIFLFLVGVGGRTCRLHLEHVLPACHADMPATTVAPYLPFPLWIAFPFVF